MKKSRSTGKTNLVSIQSVLQHTQKRTQDIFTIVKLRKLWPTIVGESIAHQTRPKKSDRGILWISVENSALNYELSLMKSTILEKIQEVMGLSYKNLKFFLEVTPTSSESQDQSHGKKFTRVEADQSEELDSILKRVKALSLELQKKK